MSDVSQLLIPCASILRVLTHEGVIGKGRDFLTGTPCSLHLLVSPLTKRRYILQLYENLTKEFLTAKIQNLSKSVLQHSVPNTLKVMALATREPKKGSQELNIIYDAEDLYGMSLENLITLRIKNGEMFKQEQIMQFFSQIMDVVYWCAQHSHEFLELTPINIFYKLDPKNRYRYFPNNFGLSFAGTQWEKKYHSPADSFFNGKNNIESALKSVVFILGMIGLQMCTLQEPKALYNSHGNIQEKVLLKTLQAVKLGYSNDLFKFLSSLCNLQEAKRPDINQVIYSEDSYFLTYRKLRCFEGKMGSYRRIVGLIKSNKKSETVDPELLEETFADITLENGDNYRGSLIRSGASLQYDGYGVLQVAKENKILVGEFKANELRQGVQITKNKQLMFGQFSVAGNSRRVHEVMLDAFYSTESNQKSVLCFVGRVDSQLRKIQGKAVEKGGAIYEGEFRENERHGKGVLKEHKKQLEVVGNWKSGQLDGNILVSQQGKKHEAIFREGKLESKKQVS